MSNIKVKVFTYLMSLILIISFMPAVNTNAASYEGKISESKLTNTIDWSYKYDVLTITGTGAIPDYTSGDNTPWSSLRLVTTKIVIGEGITYIGNYAFAGFYDVTTIFFPATLRTIGSNAFSTCKSLTAVKFPTSLVTIGSAAFAYCKALKSVVIPKGVTSIGACSFAYCDSLISVTGGAGLKKIGNAAFRNDSKLKTLKITSKKLSKIDAFAFAYDRNLKTLYFKKTTKLTKKGVRSSLLYSSVKTVKVKKSKIKKYKKAFKKSNSGRKVKVKK